MNNKSLLGSDAGKGVAPWECVLRLTRAGGRSRGLRSKAWTGRGPWGRRFLQPCKNLQPHGLPTGGITSRKRTAGRKQAASLPTPAIAAGYLKIQGNAEAICGWAK